jgi:hypothetical protein
MTVYRWLWLCQFFRTGEASMKTPSDPTNPALPCFELGELCYTPGAQAVLQRYHVHPFQLLARHVRGDWGEVCVEDAQANEDALRAGLRLLSAYILAAPVAEQETLEPVKLWVITEADRSVTTLLLQEEY